MEAKIPKAYFIIPSILLIINLIIRLVDESKLIFHFPLDITNDISSHMAQLFFLTKCGFHNLCPYWYNGFKLFLLYPPGWFFFTYPIYLLTNVQLATYISMVLMFVLGFIFIYILGKTQKLSFPKILFFFAFFFANPINIGNFIRLGSLPSMLAWVLVIPILTIIFYYKNKKIKKYFWILPILLATILITHPTESILIGFTLLSLFIIKSQLKERFKIIISGLLAVLLSSFWLIPFILNSTKQTTLAWVPTYHLLKFSGEWMWTSLATFVVIPAFIILFFLYWKYKNYSKRELLFYLPILFLAFLVLSRLIIFIPFFKNIYPDNYMLYFSFFSFFFLFKTRYNLNLHKIIKYGLILLAILLVSISLYKTPFFHNITQLEKETVSLLPYIKGKFVIFNSPQPDVYSKAVYGYAAIFYNLTTPDGLTWGDVELRYLSDISKTGDYINEEKCVKIEEQFKKYNTTHILTYTDFCSKLEKCGFEKIKSKDQICVYKTY